MKTNKVWHQDLSKIWHKLPKNIRISERSVDIQISMAYQKIAKLIQTSGITFHQELMDTIFEGTQKLEEIEDTNVLKRLLINIAAKKSVEAFRILEAYEKIAPDTLESWAYMARIQCQIQLENSLLDEPIGFIATGLGGKGQKIRYYTAVGRKTQTSWNAHQQQFLQLELEAAFKDSGSEIEQIFMNQDYILLKILVPIKVSVIDILEKGIENCAFVKPKFLITNVRKPPIEKIEAWATQEESEEF